ncbi:MAG: PAS domain-containing protein [Janthinobacterium lividum]
MSTDQSGHALFGALRAFSNASNSSIVITDALVEDSPIVFVNPAFEKMTGYAMHEVVERNCRFLQGTDRDQEDRGLIREAIRRRESCECLLRNYRKSGEMFWNKLYLFPVNLAGQEVTHFVGVQHDVTREQNLLAEFEHTAGERARLIERLELKRKHMARLSRDLINAQENERSALARELHDETARR